jgi:uncharacterized protein YjbJ (UPF0337 family)
MDKDRIEGSLKQAKGTLKEALGKATGDARLQGQGQTAKIEGKIQNAVGALKDAVKGND